MVAPNCLGRSVGLFLGDVVKEAAADNADENSDRIAGNGSGPDGSGYEVSEVRFAIGQPVCRCCLFVKCLKS